MTLISKATSGLMLAALAISVALQLGQLPVAAVLLGSSAGLAGLFLPELRCLQSATGRMLYWMVLFAMQGWILGLRQDFGPHGLMVFGSWCSTGAPEDLPALILAKASLAPHSHLFMVLSGFAGMLIGTQNADRPVLRCCAMTVLAMPLALAAAAIALLLLRNQSWLDPGLLMPLLMLVTMTLTGWLVALAIAPRLGTGSSTAARAT